MTERGIDELSRVLGGIEAGLATVIKTLADDRIASASYRTDIRREFANLSESVQGVTNDTRTCKSELADMKPKLSALEIKNIKRETAFRLGSAVINVLYLIAALLAGLAGGYFGHQIPK